MGYEAKILADSINPTGSRLTTFLVTYPRIIHAEMMTHRVFSRNSASTRAIPVNKMISQVVTDPFIPEKFGKNQKGMSASEDLNGTDHDRAYCAWLEARDAAVEQVKELAAIGVHKQLAGRLLEPFAWITVIITSTEMSNFFELRDHKDAQPEIQRIARMMKDVYVKSIPTPLAVGQYHIPMLADKLDLHTAGFDLKSLLRIAVGRIARVSYLTHDGIRDPNKDLELAENLLEDNHMSPWEHVARAEANNAFVRNFRGWTQLRALVD